eukprot:TRINITY_DN12163_c0_g1_i1.p1 TRINITY_DN12163_c0_g1~~TRINITY_DN12163_c0_g1_i1.p1  ORF type:complete len:271 (+),score=65.51 TRINITY_DN12163_c0_g1_i1:119-814(+)
MTKEEYLESDLYKKRKKRRMQKEKFKGLDRDEIEFHKPVIVFDLGYHEELTARQTRSLGVQLGHSYGYMKSQDRPLKMVLSSCNGEIKEDLEKKYTISNWKCWVEEPHFLDLYSKEELVYLSPDSENVLEEIDESKVYVIGGIVDANSMTKRSISEAGKLELTTAKLPIEEYYPEACNKSLNVNHVFQILSDVADHKDWARAFEEHIPKRKGFSKERQKAAQEKALKQKCE